MRVWILGHPWARQRGVVSRRIALRENPMIDDPLIGLSTFIDSGNDVTRICPLQCNVAYLCCTYVLLLTPHTSELGPPILLERPFFLMIYLTSCLVPAV